MADDPHEPGWRVALHKANAALRCGALAKRTGGLPCKAAAMANGRCYEIQARDCFCAAQDAPATSAKWRAMQQAWQPSPRDTTLPGTAQSQPTMGQPSKSKFVDVVEHIRTEWSAACSKALVFRAEDFLHIGLTSANAPDVSLKIKQHEEVKAPN